MPSIATGVGAGVGMTRDSAPDSMDVEWATSVHDGLGLRLGAHRIAEARHDSVGARRQSGRRVIHDGL